ncbi:conserved hypothetical protein [Candida dubliniensis CD36]|uniref:Uncharacterized protein n=1 Tax=Candida dubliniensis (strain CD36 / ATCC MYA-646 / CBS 7987 / NCPF 3949 / NRRL Y-17841) TaxID=573826 RepID=B9WLE2_CANDC|nr:conserved hypothetical protein [Candida dubliniensis CD36]CAX39902.1 conserved hypothetical protein [Candida dubliniensis CD36]
MSSVRKIAAYLERKEDLTQQYNSLKEAFKDEPDYEGLINVFEILKFLDELIYEYHVHKSYLQSTKGPINDFERKLLGEMEKTIKQLEDDVSLPYLIENAQNLALIRRELFENAHEGGRLIHAYELQNPSSKMMIRSSQPLSPSSVSLNSSPSSKSSQSQSKSPLRLSNNPSEQYSLRQIPKDIQNPARAMTWSKRCTEIVFEAGKLNGTRTQKYDYISSQIEKEFGYQFRAHFSRYLYLHYIEGDAAKFRADFDKAYTKYMNLPTDKASELIEKELQVHRNVCRYGIWLREIFQRTYGKITEPAENFSYANY